MRDQAILLYMNHSNPVNDQVVLPARFWCGGSHQWRNGGGHLCIAQDSLTFEFDRVMQKMGTPAMITHTGSTVTIVHPRIVPLIDIGILVCGDTSAVAVSCWRPIQYPKVRNALISAGFILEDVKTWVSRGEYMARTYTRRTRAAST